MNKIDFSIERRDLHREIYNAIKELVKMTKDNIVKFDCSKDNEEYPCVYFEPDGYLSGNGILVDAVRYDERLEVHDHGVSINNEYSWHPIGEGSCVVWCTIDGVYESVYNAIVNRN